MKPKSEAVEYLEELRGGPLTFGAMVEALEEGWLDGHGLVPLQADLEWFTQRYESSFPAETPIPYTYPTEDGGLYLEWNFGPWKLSIDIDLRAKAAFYHCMKQDGTGETAFELDLRSETDWAKLSEAVLAKSRDS